MMVEAEAIANALGVKFPIDVDRRIAGAGAVGAHKTSMLQDLERGRPMEIDALVTAVQELGRLTGTPTPAIDIVLALVRQRARLAGCYQAPADQSTRTSTASTGTLDVTSVEWPLPDVSSIRNASPAEIVRVSPVLALTSKLPARQKSICR